MDYSAFHWSEKARKYAETVGTIFNVKGRVNTVQDLPSTGNKVGDLWLVGLTTDPDLIEYAWLSFDNVTRWEKLGSTATSLAFSAITGSPDDNVALKNALDGKYSTSNPNGYISGITSSMVTTALGYTPYNSSNPAGYTSNVGTVTSVNNIQPVNGNVTVTIPNPLPSQTGNTGKFLTTDGTDASWGVPKTHDLFDNKWEDYLLNDQNWLRADTFSWQDGTVYSNAYNHLVADYNSIEESIYGVTNLAGDFYRYSEGDVAGAKHPYCWKDTNGYNCYTNTETPSVGDGTFVGSSGMVSDGAVESVIYAKQGYSETIGSYTITYYLASDGHKICLPDQETTVNNIYNESGVAWYYILDTANQRFKLPRELPITDKSKGNGNPISFVNVKDTGVVIPSGEYYLQEDSGDARVNYGTTNNLRTMGLNSNSTKSSIISHRANTNGQQYLYFYVGQFSQSAIEQTAGLNSELFNGKVDLDAANLSTAGKSLISGLGMPSNRYTDLTLGASGATYTAPANGYFVLRKNQSSAGQYVNININSTYVAGFTASGTLLISTGYLPVKTGDVLRVDYNAGGTAWFRFYYAEGEPNV